MDAGFYSKTELADLKALVIEDTPLFHLRAEDYVNTKIGDYNQRKVSERYFF